MATSLHNHIIVTDALDPEYFRFGVWKYLSRSEYIQKQYLDLMRLNLFRSVYLLETSY